MAYTYRIALRFFAIIPLLTATLLSPMTSADPARERPIVIAHRGASGYLPEHTLTAVTAAHVLGADYIEQDIVLSADNVPMVLHDIHLESTTDVAQRYPQRARADGRFYAIDFTLAELKTLSVTERRTTAGDPVFATRFPIADLGLRIPTLEEEIALISGLNRSRNTDVGWYIELKAPGFHEAEGYDIGRVVVDTLSAAGLNGAGSKVFLQCFDHRTLRYLKTELNTPLPLIMLIADNSWGEAEGIDYDHFRTPSGLAELADFVQGIGPWIGHILDPDTGDLGTLTAQAHALGLAVHPYTVRADALPEQVSTLNALHSKLLLEAGVDGVFTDFSDLTHAFIDEHWPKYDDQQ